MKIVNIIKLLLTMASKIAEYANNRKLMEAGEAKAILESLKEADLIIAKAQSARENAHKVDLSKDENNRKNR